MHLPPSATRLVGVAAVAATGYGALSRVVSRGATRRTDRRARRDVLAHASRRAQQLAEVTGHVGKWYTLVPLALAGAGWLARRSRYAAAVTIGATSLAAAAASRILDRIHDHRTPPPGKTQLEPDAQSYPSGHALETTAVVGAAAWVLAREGLVRPAAVVPPAIALALISGLGRLILDRHWSTDSAAGYCAGIALGATCAASYELVRG